MLCEGKALTGELSCTLPAPVIPSVYLCTYFYAFSVTSDISVLSVSYESVLVHFHVLPGRVAQSVGHLTRKSEVLGLIPDQGTYFCFSFC